MLARWPRSGTGHYRLTLHLDSQPVEELICAVLPQKISDEAYQALINDHRAKKVGDVRGHKEEGKKNSHVYDRGQPRRIEQRPAWSPVHMRDTQTLLQDATRVVAKRKRAERMSPPPDSLFHASCTS